jgi:hypothetical protein
MPLRATISAALAGRAPIAVEVVSMRLPRLRHKASLRRVAGDLTARAVAHPLVAGAGFAAIPVVVAAAVVVVAAVETEVAAAVAVATAVAADTTEATGAKHRTL